jgi:uncharacterized damage-inducible protein DinB
MISRELIRSHWEYNVWASARLLAAVSQLSPQDLTKDFGTADRSVAGTLVHIFRSERIWLARLDREFQAAPNTSEDEELRSLQAQWPTLHERWREYLAGEIDTSQIMTYKDLKGNQWSQPFWQLLLHIVNHGSHHRGQVSGFIRALGHVPPSLDVVLYYRTQLKQI